MKNNEMLDFATRTDIITDDFIEKLKELTNYNSIGLLNFSVDVLEIFRDRIDIGQKIKYDKTDEYLTLKTFADLIANNFTQYVLKAVYKDTKLKDKVYFNLENTEEGLDLIYTGTTENKLFKWIADIDKQFCFMRLLPTNVVYIRDNKTSQYIPYLSEHNSCYIYDEMDGKIKEVFN